MQYRSIRFRDCNLTFKDCYREDKFSLLLKHDSFWFDIRMFETEIEKLDGLVIEDCEIHLECDKYRQKLLVHRKGTPLGDVITLDILSLSCNGTVEGDQI